MSSCVAEIGTPRAPLSPGQTPRALRPPLPKSAPKAVARGGSGGRAGSAGAGSFGRRSEERRPRASSDADSSYDAGEEVLSPGSGPKPKARSSSSSARLPRLGGTPPPVERKDVGKVPAYLRRRQEEMAEERRRAARPPSPQPPPGYRKVCEEERQATLEVLRRRKAEVEKAQSSLPFKIETVGQRQREKDLADRLAHASRLLDMFGKPLVFVPADSDPLAAVGPSPSSGVAANGRGGASPPASASSDPVAGPRGRAGGLSRSASSELPRRRQPSRESRAAASVERRRQAGVAVPWDHLQATPPLQQVAASVRTEVKVAEPPGGRSSLQLG